MKKLCSKILLFTVMFIFLLQPNTTHALPLSPEDDIDIKTIDRYTVTNNNRIADDAGASVQGDNINFIRKIAVEEVISFAMKFEGCRYVYGASGSDTFDCSGFTMYVMNRFGIKLPHSASAQALLGDKITSQLDLRAGDLVFFNTSGLNKIIHVGIYIGDGKFIHAASDGVTVNNLSEAYYRSRYIGASRIINSVSESM